MLWESRDRKAQRLVRLGYDYLDQEEPRKAMRIAEQLWKLGNSGASEIAARGLWMMGDSKGAIDALEEGTRRWPQVAVLWSFLGEYRSETKDYERALLAFERSGHGYGAAPEWAQYNASVVLFRMGQPREALERVQQVMSAAAGAPMPQRKWLAAQCLLDLGQPEQALPMMEWVIEEHEKQVTSITMGRLLETYARALHGNGKHVQALDQACSAVRFWPSAQHSYTIIREISGEPSTSASVWNVEVAATRESPSGGLPTPFRAKYEVLADSAAEALRFVVAAQMEHDQHTVRLLHADKLGPAAGEKKGITRPLRWDPA